MLCRVFYKAKGENSNQIISQNNINHVTSSSKGTYPFHTTNSQPPSCGCYHQITTNSSHQSPPLHLPYHYPDLPQLSDHNTSMDESTNQTNVCSNTKTQDHESGLFSEFGFDFGIPSPMEFVDDDNEDNGTVFF